MRRRLNVNGTPLGVHPVGLPPGGPYKPLGQRAGPDTDKQPFSCCPGTRDCPRLHVRKHLFVNPVRCPPQGQLAECVQVSFIEKTLHGPDCHLRNIDLPLAQPLEKFGRVRSTTLIFGCLVNHPVGDRFLTTTTGYLRYDIVKTLDMRMLRSYRPRSRIKFLDILIPLWGRNPVAFVWASSSTRTSAGRALGLRPAIHLFDPYIPVFYGFPGDDGRPSRSASVSLRP
jgi:hypothetical protein